jgi:hypothetical protein
MKRIFIFLNTLIFTIFTGCAIEDTQTISQYDAKLIVSNVLRSQHSLNESAMMTSTSLCTINGTNNTYYMQDYYHPESSLSVILNGYNESIYIDTNSYFSLNYTDTLYNYNHVNGIINININNPSGYNNNNLNYLATYNDTNIYSNDYNYLINGAVGVKVDLDTINNDITLHYSTDALRLYNNIGRDTYLRDTTLDFYMNLYNNRYTYSYSGNLALSRWDNIYFQTTMPFIGYSSLNPYQGSMKIIIRSQTIFIDVIDANFLNIRLSYPNSNSYVTIRTNWRELGF